MTGATLELYLGDDGYQSSAPSERLGFYAVDLPPRALFAGDEGDAPETIFEALAGGALLGQLTVRKSDNASYLRVTLNAEALEAIQTRLGRGRFTIGAKLLSIDGSFGSGRRSERLFKRSGAADPPTRLILQGVAAGR